MANSARFLRQLLHAAVDGHRIGAQTAFATIGCCPCSSVYRACIGHGVQMTGQHNAIGLSLVLAGPGGVTDNARAPRECAHDLAGWKAPARPGCHGAVPPADLSEFEQPAMVARSPPVTQAAAE